MESSAEEIHRPLGPLKQEFPLPSEFSQSRLQGHKFFTRVKSMVPWPSDQIFHEGGYHAGLRTTQDPLPRIRLEASPVNPPGAHAPSGSQDTHCSPAPGECAHALTDAQPLPLATGGADRYPPPTDQPGPQEALPASPREAAHDLPDHR